MGKKMLAPHHLLVVWVKGLFNQRELLSTQFPVGVDELGKLNTPKEQIKRLRNFAEQNL